MMTATTLVEGAGPQSDDLLDAISRSNLVVDFSIDGQVRSANQNFLQLMHYRPEEVIGRHHCMFVRAEDRETPQYRAFWELLKAGEFVQREMRMVANGGREIWLQSSYNPILGRQGEIRSILMLATDITAEKQRAANHESTLNAISRSTAMIEFAMNGTILAANAKLAAIMGYEVQEILGRNHREFVPPEVAESEAYRIFWNRLRAGEYVEDEFPRIARCGKTIWLQASYNPILDASGRPTAVMKIATDITDRWQRNAESERLALLDPLTGVSNRRGFDLALTTMTNDYAARMEPISLLILDIDHFKAFNDTFGHQIGDLCLRVIAKAIELALQPRPDSLVCRYGGEEFAVLLPAADQPQAAAVAEDIRGEIAALKISHPGNTGWERVTTSIGSATIEPDPARPSQYGTELVAAADKALYAAKRRGRNRVVDAVIARPESPSLAFDI